MRHRLGCASRIRTNNSEYCRKTLNRTVSRHVNNLQQIISSWHSARRQSALEKRKLRSALAAQRDILKGFVGLRPTTLPIGHTTRSTSGHGTATLRYIPGSSKTPIPSGRSKRRLIGVCGSYWYLRARCVARPLPLAPCSRVPRPASPPPPPRARALRGRRPPSLPAGTPLLAPSARLLQEMLRPLRRQGASALPPIRALKGTTHTLNCPNPKLWRPLVPSCEGRGPAGRGPSLEGWETCKRESGCRARRARACAAAGLYGSVCCSAQGGVVDVFFPAEVSRGGAERGRCDCCSSTCAPQLEKSAPILMPRPRCR